MVQNKLVEDARHAFCNELEKREVTLRAIIKKKLGGYYDKDLIYDGPTAIIAGTDYMLYINQYNDLRLKNIRRGPVYAISKLSEVHLVLNGMADLPELI